MTLFLLGCALLRPLPSPGVLDVPESEAPAALAELVGSATPAPWRFDFGVLRVWSCTRTWAQCRLVVVRAGPRWRDMASARSVVLLLSAENAAAVEAARQETAAPPPKPSPSLPLTVTCPKCDHTWSPS